MVKQRNAHHQILVEELGRPFAVGPDPTCQSCQVDEDLGLGVGQHSGGGVRVGEVIIRLARDKDICAAGFELLNDEGAEEAGAAGDGSSFVVPEFVCHIFTGCMLWDTDFTEQ